MWRHCESFEESEMFWRQPMGQFRTERYGGFLYIWVEGGNHSNYDFMNGFWQLLCKRGGSRAEVAEV